MFERYCYRELEVVFLDGEGDLRLVAAYVRIVELAQNLAEVPLDGITVTLAVVGDAMFGRMVEEFVERLALIVKRLLHRFQFFTKSRALCFQFRTLLIVLLAFLCQDCQIIGFHVSLFFLEW